MTESARHLSWENFEVMIKRGVPAIHRVAGRPKVDMFVDEGGHRIGLRTPFEDPEPPPPSPVAAINVATVWLQEHLLEVSTSERRLYPEFYSFCVSLADRIQLGKQAPLTALLATLSNWEELLSPASGLSIERQLGLMGELWVLLGLTSNLGVEAVHSWTGPLGEPHDFRLSDTEFEVKVTLSPTRSHMINGDQQLWPSPGHQLWIVSLQLEPAGTGGVTMGDLIEAVRLRLRENAAILNAFDNALSLAGFHNTDIQQYKDKWQFRNQASLVPVDENCPRITRDFLEASFPSIAHRLSELHYRINLEGLGFSQSSEAFQAVLPIGEVGMSGSA